MVPVVGAFPVPVAVVKVDAKLAEIFNVFFAESTIFIAVITYCPGQISWPAGSFVAEVNTCVSRNQSPSITRV